MTGIWGVEINETAVMTYGGSDADHARRRPRGGVGRRNGVSGTAPRLRGGGVMRQTSGLRTRWRRRARRPLRPALSDVPLNEVAQYRSAVGWWLGPLSRSPELVPQALVEPEALAFGALGRHASPLRCHDAGHSTGELWCHDTPGRVTVMTPESLFGPAERCCEHITASAPISSTHT